MKELLFPRGGFFPRQRRVRQRDIAKLHKEERLNILLALVLRWSIPVLVALNIGVFLYVRYLQGLSSKAQQHHGENSTMSAGAHAIAMARVVSLSQSTGHASSTSMKDVEGQEEGEGEEEGEGGEGKGGNARHMRIGRGEGQLDRETDFPAQRIAKVDLPVEDADLDIDQDAKQALQASELSRLKGIREKDLITESFYLELADRVKQGAVIGAAGPDQLEKITLSDPKAVHEIRKSGINGSLIRGGMVGNSEQGSVRGGVGRVGRCGDGVLDPEEQCDDGKRTWLDGCSGECRIEDGWMCWNMSLPVSYLIAEVHAVGRNMVPGVVHLGRDSLGGEGGSRMVPRVVLGYGVEWDAARQRLQRMEKGDGVGKVYMGRGGGHSCLQLTPGNVLVIERSQDRMGIAVGVLGHLGRDSLGGEGGSCLQDCSECQESDAGGEECLKRCEDLPKIEICSDEAGEGDDGCILLHPRHGGRVCFYKGEEALERCMIHPQCRSITCFKHVSRGDDDHDDDKDQSSYGGREINLSLESQICYASSLGIEESETEVLPGAGEGPRGGDAGAGSAAEGTSVVSDMLVYRGFESENIGRGRRKGGRTGLKGRGGNAEHVSKRQVQKSVWSNLGNCVGEFGCSTFFIVESKEARHREKVWKPKSSVKFGVAGCHMWSPWRGCASAYLASKEGRSLFARTGLLEAS